MLSQILPGCSKDFSSFTQQIFNERLQYTQHPSYQVQSPTSLLPFESRYAKQNPDSDNQGTGRDTLGSSHGP